MLVLSGTAAAVPRLSVPYHDAEATIDGIPDEKVWQSSAHIPKLQDTGGSHADGEATEIRLWYNSHSLYFFWQCRDSDIQATMVERDSELWEEEAVEIFITPDSLNQYFELQWNPLGAVFDAIIENRLLSDGISAGITGHWDWTASGMISTVRMSEDGNGVKTWNVEVQLPFSDLKRTTPTSGEVWHANFFRINRSGDAPPEYTSWSPVFHPRFHQPLRFGHLIFTGDLNSNQNPEN